MEPLHNVTLRQVGSIRRLVVSRGFGFIRTEDGRDWFFHYTELKGPRPFNGLTEGENVSFVGVPDAPKGPRATDVETV